MNGLSAVKMVDMILSGQKHLLYENIPRCKCHPLDLTEKEYNEIYLSGARRDYVWAGLRQNANWKNHYAELEAGTYVEERETDDE